MSNEQEESYMLDDKGRLFREGTEIGTVKDGKLSISPDHKKYAAPATRWLNSQEEKPVAPEAKKKTPEEILAEENENLTRESQTEVRKAREMHADDLAFCRDNKLPDPPKKNPQFGDKTPAYVEWLKKHRPEVFAKRFRVKGIGKVPVIRRNEDGIEEVTGYKDAEMSERKTHLTEKVETTTGMADDMDWDA
jgi:hypothetical protein